jgi:hypothetical protein
LRALNRLAGARSAADRPYRCDCYPWQANQTAQIKERPWYAAPHRWSPHPDMSRASTLGPLVLGQLTGRGSTPATDCCAVHPCGNFSDTSSLKFKGPKGSIGHDFSVCIFTENQNQVSFYPFVLQEISVLFELTLGHLRYCLTDVPPQPNSPSDNVFNVDQPVKDLNTRNASEDTCSI